MAERMTKYKLFFVWEYEKEEKWLNEMAMNGWVLVNVGLCRFTFEKCEPNEYIIRMEMRQKDDDYISFMEDTGAQFIGRCLQWQYFKRKSELGQFDIFSDINSRIDHLKNIHKTTSMLALANLLLGIVNLNMGIYNTSNSIVAVLNFLCTSFLSYGVGRIKGKIEYLENERMIRE